MIPAGVVRIITAAAPSEAVRDAMLGDFAEEYQLRAQRDGQSAARRWCWTQALRSLADTLRHSFPSPWTIVSNVVPAMLWGYLIGVLCMLAILVVTWPILVMLKGVLPPMLVARLIAIGATIPIGIIVGFETARVGSKAPLWSALLLAGCVIAASIRVFTVNPTLLLFPQLWYAAAALVPTIPMILVGAVLQQSMWYRFGFSKPPTTA